MASNKSSRKAKGTPKAKPNVPMAGIKKSNGTKGKRYGCGGKKSK